MLGEVHREVHPHAERAGRHLKGETPVRRHHHAAFGTNRVDVARGAAVCDAVVARRAVTVLPALAGARAASANEGRGAVGCERADDAGPCIGIRALGNLAAVLDALPALRAVDRREALDLTETVATNQVVGALGIVGARLPAGGARLLRHLGETAVADLFLLRTGTRDAGLARKAIGVALTLITTLRVGRAYLTLRAIGVVGTVALGVELTDVERAVARHAAKRRRAIARARASHVAAAERAHEGCIAVGVDQAPLRQIGERWVVARAGDSEEGHAHPSAKHPHHVHHPSSAGFHLYMVPSM